MVGNMCSMGYHEKELQIQACDWPQSDDEEVKAGLSTLRNRKLDEEGENSHEVGVDVVERELHEHSTGPMETHTGDTEPHLVDHESR